MEESRTTTLRAYFNSVASASKDSNPPNLAPILTSLNGDNAWLISFPLPASHRRQSRKAYYHVTSDVWLTGPAVTLHSWLVWIGMQTPAAITSGVEVDEVVFQIEALAREAGLVDVRETCNEQERRGLDAVFANFHYHDHLSEATLRTFDKRIPVFATPEAAQEIEGWRHFETVIVQKNVQASDREWKSLHPGNPLPEWLSVFRIPGHHELQFATAMVWSADRESGEDEELQHQALLYSPHGIYATEPTLQSFANQFTPRIKVHAILHALKDSYTAGSRNTLGVSGGLALEKLVRSKYWVKSHDSLLDYRGIVMRLTVRDYPRTLESGVKELLGLKGKEGNTEEDSRIPNLVEVENGRCVVLE